MKIGLDISVLNETNRTGIAVYTFNLIDNLIRRYRGDKFILFGVSTLETYDYLKSLKFHQYPNVQLKIFRMPAKFFRLAFLTWQKLNWPPVEHLISEVDVFHCFNWFFPPQRKGKAVASVFDITPISSPHLHQKKTVQLDKVRFGRIYGYADLVVTISENSRKDFLNHYPGKKVEVVYPAASRIFKKINRERVGKVLQKYGLQTGYILSVATLEPRKNLRTLVDVYLDKGFDASLVLVGGGGWKIGEFNEITRNHSDKIKLLGFVPDEDLPALYAGAKCLAYLSLYEGFGLPVVEAMSCGTPVICSNTSSLPEVGGDAAIFVNPLDKDGICRALKSLESKNLREKLIQRGLVQARKFSWEASARQLRNCYEELLNG